MGGRSLSSRGWLFALAAAAALPSMAFGQGAPGADITHSNLQDASHYGPVGTTPANRIHAYAWGSWTCNIGTSSLSWINGGTPGLEMGAYRLHNGRLTQIGIGHAKGGCCVANGSGCNLTCSTSGFGLRPGCRDIYGSGFNGGQSRLIAHHLINPYTGAFSAIPSGTGDAIWRRCQVKETDMSATTFAGALYFAEGLYVCTEEPVQNKNNNATYRRMTVANTGAAPTYVWTPTDTSQVGIPAIFAWRDHGLGLNTPDPSVKIITVDVPGEGRFFAASRAYDNGNGTWRYEYGVFNLYSDRAGESFKVPLDASATVSNVFFSAPQWHSGEPYSNTPWGTARDTVVGTFTWGATEKFGSNPNANALRWGALFSMSFTVNRAPVIGTARLTLFKPGTPEGVDIGGLDVPGEPPCPADFNNDGTVNPDDLGDYINCYFQNPPCPAAEMNNDNVINPDDLGDYINFFFGPAC